MLRTQNVAERSIMYRHTRSRWLCIATFVFAASTLTVHADKVDMFTLVIGADTITWSIPIPDTPIQVFEGGFGFSAPVAFDGMSMLPATEDFLPDAYFSVSFGTSEFGYDYGLYVAPFYRGPANSPVFFPIKDEGLSGFLTSSPLNDPTVTNPVSGEITVAEVSVPIATPEPSTFALLGTGLLGIVGAIKQRYA
jgi:PEP-CTERM motif